MPVGDFKLNGLKWDLVVARGHLPSSYPLAAFVGETQDGICHFVI